MRNDPLPSVSNTTSKQCAVLMSLSMSLIRSQIVRSAIICPQAAGGEVGGSRRIALVISIAPSSSASSGP